LSAQDTIRFGLFDWLDVNGRSLESGYEDRLKVCEYADKAGFFAYHLAEHHGTPLSTVASPNVFLAALAQRTTRLRLGPLVYVLPLYNPLRLMEEICMLDNISHGRLELGIGRGVSAWEFAPYKVDLAENRAMFTEIWDIMVQGWTTGTINYEGKFFQYKDVHTEYRPLQQPYPPLWYPTSNRNSIEWVGNNGIRTAFSMHLAPSMQAVREMVDMYWAAYNAHEGEPGRLNAHADIPLCGISGHVHVADTDEQAKREARAGYELFHHNFVALRMKEEDLYRYAGLDFDKLYDSGRFFCGSPETVKHQLKNCFDSTGANYFMANFTFGSMTEQQLLHSIDLFAREVMPAFENPSHPRPPQWQRAGERVPAA